VSNVIDPRKLVAEVVGVFALLFVGAGAVVVAAGNANIGLIEIALAHGLALALVFAALGHLSGGYFNPAVTTGLWVTRRIGSLEAAAYIMAQLLGAVLGALALNVLFPQGLRNASDLGTPVLGPSVDFMTGIGIEVILTAFLVLAVFGAVVHHRNANTAGLVIGLTVTMGMLVAAPLTGGVMNPARAFGPALLSGEWTDQAVWWIGPLIGGVIAAMLYHYLFSDEAGRSASPAT